MKIEEFAVNLGHMTESLCDEVQKFCSLNGISASLLLIHNSSGTTSFHYNSDIDLTIQSLEVIIKNLKERSVRSTSSVQ